MESHLDSPAVRARPLDTGIPTVLSMRLIRLQSYKIKLPYVYGTLFQPVN